jgi:hypothetical protein
VIRDLVSYFIPLSTSSHLISLKDQDSDQGPSPFLPSDPNSLVGQVLNSDDRCEVDVEEDISDKGPLECDGRSGKVTCVFSSIHLISLEVSKGPRGSSQLPPSILDSPTAPTASFRKPGKVHPNLVSAINAVYNTDSAEESSEDVDGSNGIASRNEIPLRSVQMYTSDSAEDDPMDSGARVTKQSSRLVRSSSSSEEVTTDERPVSKSRTANRNNKARSRKAPHPPDTKVNPRRRRDKLAHDRPRILLKPPQPSTPPVLKRKREDTETSHLHVIDLTGDLEDEVWVRII